MRSIVGAALAIVLAASSPGVVRAQPAGVQASRLLGVGFNVADLQRSLDFYTQTFGMKEISRHEGAQITEVVLSYGNAPGEAILVIVKRRDQPLPNPNATGVGWGRIMISTKDVKALVEKVRTSRGKVEREPRENSRGPSTASIRDPDGNSIEAVQNPPDFSKAAPK